MSIGQIRIATRSSKLAMAQSCQVRDMIHTLAPEIEISFVEVSTKGDRDKSDFLYKSSSVGFFTSEVEKTLLTDRADVAVHSLKDLPTQIQQGLTIAAIPTRQDVSDVIIANHNINSIDDLPKGAIVGTSSLRRIAQIKHLRTDLDCQPLRGNVETRIQKLRSEQYDAIVIAQAGLNRLNMQNEISLILNPNDFIPAPGQGALAIQTRTEDSELVNLLSQLDNKNARLTSTAERLVLSKLHGGCSIPLGVYSEINENNMSIIAVLSNTDASQYVRITKQTPIDQMEQTCKKNCRRTPRIRRQ